jgi:bifunctional non-homologous end joining protein LigD
VKSLLIVFSITCCAAASKRPFKNATEHDRRSHWVEPKLVCEVVFTEWPPDGSIQHPSFKGLRTHKPAKAIVREEPVATR